MNIFWRNYPKATLIMRFASRKAALKDAARLQLSPGTQRGGARTPTNEDFQETGADMVSMLHIHNTSHVLMEWIARPVWRSGRRWSRRCWSRRWRERLWWWELAWGFRRTDISIDGRPVRPRPGHVCLQPPICVKASAARRGTACLFQLRNRTEQSSPSWMRTMWIVAAGWCARTSDVDSATFQP